MRFEGFRFTWFLRWALLAALWFPINARRDETDEKIPKPEPIELETKDHLRLHATFYPAREMKDPSGAEIAKKLRVPVILVHGFKGDQFDLEHLALLLQARGHVVITPDLRGHGESTQITRTGESGPDKIDGNALKGTDILDMVRRDMEAIKSFLVEKNNAGELNIDKLCVVGADMGAVVAINWAQLDWSWPVFPGGKQGQDVKALVLISPESNFKGYRTIDAINDPQIRSDLAVLLIAGHKSSRSTDEVNKLYRHFSKYHQDKSSPALEKLLPETKLQGAALLGEKSLGVEDAIVKFINQQADRPFPWAERKSLSE